MPVKQGNDKFTLKTFYFPNNAIIFALAFSNNDSVAQLVEHFTFNEGVLGSNPSGITSCQSNKAQKPENTTFSGFFVFTLKQNNA
jgi:hypothetical protein